MAFSVSFFLPWRFQLVMFPTLSWNEGPFGIFHLSFATNCFHPAIVSIEICLINQHTDSQ